MGEPYSGSIYSGYILFIADTNTGRVLPRVFGYLEDLYLDRFGPSNSNGNVDKPG
jgi:hypothetical protein